MIVCIEKLGQSWNLMTSRRGFQAHATLLVWFKAIGNQKGFQVVFNSKDTFLLKLWTFWEAPLKFDFTQ